MSKLILETISPVHIGSGEKYSQSEFIIKNNKILKLDINKIYSLLNPKDKDIFIDSLEYPDFRLEEFLKGKDISISEVKVSSQDIKSGEYPKEINEHIKTNLKGFIPGSSLKGAIKTAIFNAFIGKKEIGEIGKIFTISNPRQREREIERFMDGFFSNSGKNSSYFDFMRFIQISDFIPVDNLSIYTVQSLEADGNSWRWYRRNGRIVQSYIETISVGEHLEGDIHLTYKDKIYQSLGLLGKKAILDITEIKRLIYDFSANIIDHEITFSQNYDIDFLFKFYEELKKVNKQESPLIKLGQGSGYLATTIGLEIKKYPEVYDKVRMSLRGKSYSYEFPKTRKIVVEEKMPLGWCKIL